MKAVVVVVLALCWVTRGDVNPRGHLEPLGAHRDPERPITELYELPTPRHFFENFVKPGEPVLFKEAAKHIPAYSRWTDEYLSQKFGAIKMDVEEGKKENRLLGTFNFKLQEFIKRYKKEDVYMVESLPPKMQEEYMLLKSLRCGGFTNVLQDAVMWFSSGGTKSVLHFDAVENINCLFSGSKKFVMIDKKFRKQAHIDRLDGSYSSVDVEKVDMHKFPGLQTIPWYNVSMSEGDCLYIPYMWIHQVQSYGSRNLAINIWWAHFTFFNETDCEKSKYKNEEYVPLSHFTFKPMETTRQRILEEMGRTTVTQDEWITLLQKLATVLDLEQNTKETYVKNFQELDSNKDGRVSADEILQIQSSDIERLLSPGFVSESDEKEDEEKEDGREIVETPADKLNKENKRNSIKQEL